MSDLHVHVDDADDPRVLPRGTHAWIGSDPGCWIVLGNGASPLHALVVHEGSSPIVLAAPGHEVERNGAEAGPSFILRHGDRLRVGESTLTVGVGEGDEAPGDPRTVEPPPPPTEDETPEIVREAPLVKVFLPPPKTKAVPEELHSVYEEGPFRTCSDCGEALLDPRPGYERLYCAAKVHRNDTCIFEVALCHICTERLREQFSEESQEVLQAEAARAKRGGLERCGLCGKDADAIDAYGVSWVSHGSGYIPRTLEILCDECDRDLEDKLSRQTRDAWGDWVETHVPGVPAGLDLSFMPV